jgi:hypothetical protein
MVAGQYVATTCARWKNRSNSVYYFANYYHFVLCGNPPERAIAKN